MTKQKQLENKVFKKALKAAHNAGYEAAKAAALNSMFEGETFGTGSLGFKGLVIELSPCNSKFANFIKRNGCGLYKEWRSAIIISPKLSGLAIRSRMVNNAYVDAFIASLNSAGIERVNLAKSAR